MREFLDNDFFLSNSTSEQLYHDFAADLPIIDYHNHLPPIDIATDKHFSDITEAWFAGDHYKWRAMRANGIEESYITGDRNSLEKFKKWAETVPKTLRNPLYQWTHLELRRYFGINKQLDAKSARYIYNETSEQLQGESFGCQGLLTKMNVIVVCTTDDPLDSLAHHLELQQQKEFETKVLPTFRPDKSLALHDPITYNKYLDQLEHVAGKSIIQLSDLFEVLEDRINFFHESGCRLSDHGLNRMPFAIAKFSEVKRLFAKVRNGLVIHTLEIEQLQTTILLELCRIYCKKGWTQQFHLGALRNNSKRALRKLGPDTGFDSIGDFSQAQSLSSFLDTLDNDEKLAKTILYNLNPRDNEVMATMAGNFNDGITSGKIQFGSGWWYLDQKNGMQKQLNTLSNMGLLSQFVGMLTDSRSFLSFPRHEYFRRILCELIGRDVENGELPNDISLLGEMVKDICFNNAEKYFGFFEE
jgi:glucuronate isomerase